MRIAAGVWAPRMRMPVHLVLQAYLADAVLTLKAVPISAQDKRQLRAFRSDASLLLQEHDVTLNGACAGHACMSAPKNTSVVGPHHTPAMQMALCQAVHLG